jgi:SWI/SNF-related matrix-associated actin-dependent regulator 1 of chromatin subfamily A
LEEARIAAEKAAAKKAAAEANAAAEKVAAEKAAKHAEKAARKRAEAVAMRAAEEARAAEVARRREEARTEAAAKRAVEIAAKAEVAEAKRRAEAARLSEAAERTRAAAAKREEERVVAAAAAAAVLAAAAANAAEKAETKRVTKEARRAAAAKAAEEVAVAKKAEEEAAAKAAEESATAAAAAKAAEEAAAAKAAEEEAAIKAAKEATAASACAAAAAATTAEAQAAAPRAGEEATIAAAAAAAEPYVSAGSDMLCDIETQGARGCGNILRVSLTHAEAAELAGVSAGEPRVMITVMPTSTTAETRTPRTSLTPQEIAAELKPGSPLRVSMQALSEEADFATSAAVAAPVTITVTAPAAEMMESAAAAYDGDIEVELSRATAPAPVVSWNQGALHRLLSRWQIAGNVHASTALSAAVSRLDKLTTSADSSAIASEVSTAFSKPYAQLLPAPGATATAESVLVRLLCHPHSAAPEWQPDCEAQSCNTCTREFRWFRRRHHCRLCGLVFCGACSDQEAPLPWVAEAERVRIGAKLGAKQLKERLAAAKKEGRSLNEEERSVNIDAIDVDSAIVRRKCEEYRVCDCCAAVSGARYATQLESEAAKRNRSV